MSFFDSVKSWLFPAEKPKSKNVITRTSKTYNTYTTPKSTNKSTNNYAIGMLQSNGLSTMNSLQKQNGISAGLAVPKPVTKPTPAITPSVSKPSTQSSSSSSYDGGFSDAGGGYAEPTTPAADFSGYQTPAISPEIQAQLDRWNQLQAGLSADEIASLQTKANTDAKTQNAEQRAYYDKLLGELGTAKTDQLGVLNNNLNRAISSSQEQAFLNALKSQQDAASRGMTGQAISVDAALRNNMQSQRAMGETYATSDQNIKSLLDGYNKNVGDINTEKGKLIDSVTAQKLFDTYKNNALADKKDQSNAIMDYVKNVAPYAMPTANNVLDNYTKVSMNNSDLDMKRQELAANVNKWQTDAQLKSADLSLGWAELENKVNQTNANIANMEANMVNNSLKLEFQSTKAALDNVSSLLKNTKDKSQQEVLTKYYNELVNKLGQTYAADAATP